MVGSGAGRVPPFRSDRGAAFSTHTHALGGECCIGTFLDAAGANESTKKPRYGTLPDLRLLASHSMIPVQPLFRACVLRNKATAFRGLPFLWEEMVDEQVAKYI